MTGTVDRNRDGTIDASEAVIVTSDAEGAYRLEVEIPAGQTVVVGFRFEGTAPVFRTVHAEPGSHFKLNAILVELQQVDCLSGERCHTQDGQGFPLDSAGKAIVPAPLSSGDTLHVYVTGEQDGYPQTGVGEYQVP